MKSYISEWLLGFIAVILSIVGASAILQQRFTGRFGYVSTGVEAIIWGSVLIVAGLSLVYFVVKMHVR